MLSLCLKHEVKLFIHNLIYRKTAAQIRRLRESIQSKAFKMNNPPAYYEKRKNNIKSAVTQKISEEERLDQENQVNILTALHCRN